MKISLSLEPIRKALGPPPRGSHGIKFYLHYWLLRLLGRKAARSELCVQAEFLLHGKVVWGVLAKANSLLFGPGKDTMLPGAVLYAEGVNDEMAVQQLCGAVELMHNLSGTVDSLWTPQTRAFMALFEDDSPDYDHTPVPSQISPFMPCTMSPCMFYRSNLPNGFIEGQLIPLLIRPGELAAVIPLPSPYWDKSFRENWSAVSKSVMTPKNAAEIFAARQAAVGGNPGNEVDQNDADQAHEEESGEADTDDESDPQYQITASDIPVISLVLLEKAIWEAFAPRGLVLHVVDIAMMTGSDKGDCTIIGPPEEERPALALLTAIIKRTVAQDAWPEVGFDITTTDGNGEETERWQPLIAQA